MKAYPPIRNFDTLLLLLSAKSIARGEKMIMARSTPGDLGVAYQESIDGWPAGYSVLATPIIKLTDDPWLADFTLQWAGSVLFFVATYAILKQLHGFTERSRLGLWCYWAFLCSPLGVGFPYHDYTMTHGWEETTVESSGIIAVGCYSLALAISMTMAARRNPSASMGLIVGGLAGLAGLFRFPYWPLIIVFPLSFGLLAYLDGRRWLQPSLSSGLAAAAGLTMVAWLDQSLIGSVAPAYPLRQTGIFWSSLSRFYVDFLSWPFGMPTSWPSVCASQSWPEIAATLGRRLFDLAVLFALVHSAYLAFRATREKSENSDLTLPFFWFVGLLTIAITCGMLGILAVRNPPKPWGTTPASIGRYFAPTYLFSVIALFTSAQQPRFGRIFGAFILLAGCSYGALLAPKLSYIASTLFEKGNFGPGPTLIYNTARELLRAEPGRLLACEEAGQKLSILELHGGLAGATCVWGEAKHYASSHPASLLLILRDPASGAEEGERLAAQPQSRLLARDCGLRLYLVKF